MYFEEGLKTAQTAVADALGKYNSLLDSLGKDERGKLQRSMGMKMEQLKVRCCSQAGALYRDCHRKITCPVVASQTPLLYMMLQACLRASSRS